MKPEAVIFDLDDTLVAFDLVTESTWRQVCEEYVSRNPALTAEQVYAAVSSESRWYWSDDERHRIGRNDIAAARRGIVQSAFEKNGFPAGDAPNVADRYSALRLENMYLLPGANETLSTIAAGRIPLCLMSNGDSPIQRDKLRRFDLEKYFDIILIEGEVGFGKPDKRIYRLALSKLKSSPGKTIMVGDNLKWDVGGPQSAGIVGVWYDVRGQGLPADSPVAPDAIITDLPQLIELIHD